jgi:pyruvate ferredoxin oxidoreductase alpha subunit
LGWWGKSKVFARQGISLGKNCIKDIFALTSNHAVAYAVKSLDVDVIASYPITPQTTIVEKLAEFVANGELDAEFVNVESEHSALSVILGASAAGARTFTATSSQGFLLMHEILHNVAGLRLPVVMALPSRAVSAPISIHGDYSDLMTGKDVGWIIFVCASAQEVYDTVLQAYAVAEDERVCLPAMVSYDGFLMSHTMERVEIYHDELIFEFTPKKVRQLLSPENPLTLGELALPDSYYKYKYSQLSALEDSAKVIKEVHEKFYEFFRIRYDFIEEYYIEDADFIIVAYGGASWGNAVEAVKITRYRGLKTGALRIRVLRPFPSEAISSALKNAKAFAVVDRAISFGASTPGPVYTDVLASLAKHKINLSSLCVIAGIGQKTMYVNDLVEVFEELAKGKEGVKLL